MSLNNKTYDYYTNCLFVPVNKKRPGLPKHPKYMLAAASFRT